MQQHIVHVNTKENKIYNCGEPEVLGKTRQQQRKVTLVDYTAKCD